MLEQNNNIREKIDNGPVSVPQIVIILIGFILNCVDGIDVVAISVAAPAITQSWGINSVQMGYILSAALFGMTLGALILAPLGDVYGRRKIVLIATFITGLSMIATGFVDHSLPAIISLRAISGIGIGAIFATAATFGSEFTPEKYKNMAVTMIISGYPFGAMIVGPIATLVIPSQGWEMLFIYAGFATLLICVLAYALLPESVQYIENSDLPPDEKLFAINKVLQQINHAPIDRLEPMADSLGNQKVRVGKLLSPDLKMTTLKLWVIFFMGFLTIYFLLTWVPLMFVNSGYSMTEGIFALTLNNLGAMAGTFTIGFLGTKYRLSVPIGIYFFATAVFMIYVMFAKPSEITVLYILIFIIGTFVNGAFSAMYAAAARLYQTAVRSTGVGWCAGLGRIGAILAPIFAGYLIILNFGMYALFAVFAIPVLIAALLILTIRV